MHLGDASHYLGLLAGPEPPALLSAISEWTGRRRNCITASRKAEQGRSKAGV